MRSSPTASPIWLCIHLHRLALDVVQRSLGTDADGPLAVIDQRGSQRWLVDFSQVLRSSGLKPGLGLSAAYALVPDLQVLPRQRRAERQALEQVAGWAFALSSQVHLYPPDMVLVELGGSRRLLGERWQQALRETTQSWAYRNQLALAPTPTAARLLARARRYGQLASLSPPPAGFLKLPVGACELDEETQRQLTSMGCGSLGELLKLPREGLLRRFGQPLLDYLDQLLGRRPETLPAYEPASTFASQLELSSEVGDAEALLFSVQRLLGELAQFLRARDQAVSEFELELIHSHGEHTPLKFGLLELDRDSQRLFDLTRERLQQLTLRAPVRQLVLRASRLFAFDAVAEDLFQARAPLSELARLLERLRARLGADGVHSLGLHADHRPERGSRPWPVNEPSPQVASPANPRPLWLLPRPRPLPGCSGQILSGPERIESGWWDGVDIRRDYYVVEQRRGERWWIYQDCRTRGWYLHGLF
ncbi:MAG: DNA polymerase Y family protein [Pseudomonadota bacterium]